MAKEVRKMHSSISRFTYRCAFSPVFPSSLVRQTRLTSSPSCSSFRGVGKTSRHLLVAEEWANAVDSLSSSSPDADSHCFRFIYLSCADAFRSDILSIPPSLVFSALQLQPVMVACEVCRYHIVLPATWPQYESLVSKPIVQRGTYQNRNA